ncbi:MAG: GAF domain-containing protein [Flavipsychrobacter sp.]
MGALTAAQEQERLNEVHRFLQLDFDQTKEFQNIVDLASEIGNTPVALITLLDKDANWVKAKSGLELPEAMPRETSFCQYAISQTGTLIINDATKDNRFDNNPLVHEPPSVRFYAGAPIVVKGSIRLGNLCLFDVRPNELNDFQERALEVLARQATYIMELKLSQKILQQHIDEIEDKNAKFQKIAHVQSHEVRQPLTSIMGIINIIKEDGYKADEDKLRMLEEAAHQLDNKIHEIVSHTIG